MTEGCLAVRNRSSGFYANHHLMGGDWSYNSAYRNSNDFNFLMRPPDNSADIDGVGHRIIGNLSYRGNRDVTKLDAAKCDLKENAFATDKKFTDASFESVDEAALVQDEIELVLQVNGKLPKHSTAKDIILAVIGDLAESVVKRAIHAKDSGSMLPGIGGSLDLIDSICFTAPALYFYLKWILLPAA